VVAIVINNSSCVAKSCYSHRSVLVVTLASFIVTSVNQQPGVSVSVCLCLSIHRKAAIGCVTLSYLKDKQLIMLVNMIAM